MPAAWLFILVPVTTWIAFIIRAAAAGWGKLFGGISPVSIQASKEAALSGLGMPLEEACAHNFPGTAKLWKSKDAIEGPLAFAQKRKPQWKNE